jgi:hypothetical protein
VKELQPAIADLSKALIDRKTSWSVNCPRLVQDFLLIGGEAQLPLGAKQAALGCMNDSPRRASQCDHPTNY